MAEAAARLSPFISRYSIRSSGRRTAFYWRLELTLSDLYIYFSASLLLQAATFSCSSRILFMGDDPRRQRGAGQRQLSDAHRSTAMEISGARVSGGGWPATEGNELEEEEEKVRIDSSTHKQIERDPGEASETKRIRPRLRGRSTPSVGDDWPCGGNIFLKNGLKCPDILQTFEIE